MKIQRRTRKLLTGLSLIGVVERRQTMPILPTPLSAEECSLRSAHTWRSELVASATSPRAQMAAYRSLTKESNLSPLPEGLTLTLRSTIQLTVKAGKSRFVLPPSRTAFPLIEELHQHTLTCPGGPPGLLDRPISQWSARLRYYLKRNVAERTGKCCEQSRLPPSSVIVELVCHPGRRHM